MADLRVVGVTGTDGKSTTTHLVESVLAASGATVSAVSTVARSLAGRRRPATGRLTTPEADEVASVLAAAEEAGCRWAVLETSSHGLALGRVDAVPFDVGVVTNVTHEHLDFHGSPAAYRRAKGILLDRVGERGGTVVVHVDDPGAASLLAERRGLAAVRCGTGPDADVRADDVRPDGWGTRFVLRTPAGDAPVRLTLPGGFNVANALCAAGVGVVAGLDVAAVATGLESFVPLPGRMQRVEAGQPFTLVVDYAHTPAALEAVLPVLRRLHPDGRLILVVGSAGERDRLKRPWMGHLAARLADVVVLTVEDPRGEDPGTPVSELAAGALAAGAVEGHTLHRVIDRRDAIGRAVGLARAGDCVVLAGKGHEGSIEWADHVEAWDEVAVATEALAALAATRTGGGPT